MSFFDQLLNMSPEQNQGLLGLAQGLLQASGPSRMPVGFGQALGAGLQGMQAGQSAERERQMQALQAKMMNFKLKDAESDLNNHEAQRQRAAALQKFNQDYFAKQQGVVAAGAMPAMPDAPLGAVPQASMPVQPSAAQPAQQSPAGGGGMGDLFNQHLSYAKAAYAGGFPEAAAAAEEKALKFMPQVEKYESVYGPDGKVYKKPYFKDGTAGPLIPAEVAEKLEKVNTGGTTALVNPFTGGTVRSMTNTMSPEGAANYGIAKARLGLERQRLQMERDGTGKPVFNADAGGFVLPPSAANPQGKLIPLPGGPVGGKMTEDQAKATGWVVQAENAYKNLQSVAYEKGADGKIKADSKGNPILSSAARPGLGDAVAGLPFMAGVGNALRSTDRQKFNQAASSGAEALLRAATGAGVNKEEALQKVQELTPIWGEDPEVSAQKLASWPLYIQTLKVRAGPGAAKAAGVLGGSMPTGSGWSIEKVGN